MIAQIVLGNFILLIILLLLSEFSNLTALLDGHMVWGAVLGMTLGLIFGLAYGVLFDLVWGVAWGAALIVAFGVAFGVAGGMAIDVIIGLTEGLSNDSAYNINDGFVVGIGAGITFGMLYSAVESLTSNKAASIVGGAVVCIIGGVAFGIIVSIALGMQIGITTGITSSITFIITCSRFHVSLIWLTWNFSQWLGIQKNSHYVHQAFSISAIQLDELIYMPLPLFGRLLSRCMEANLDQALEMLTVTAQSTGQKWAVGYATPHWLAHNNRAMTDLPDLATVAQMSDTVAKILEDLPRQKSLSNLLHDFASVAYSLSNIEQAHTPTIIRQVLERNNQDIYQLKARARLLKRPELVGVADHWQQLIQGYAFQPDEVLGPVLSGAYQAGSALETGTSLFRGRRDLFAITNEVYANPQRAETLLLVAQQRMGKSSALMQLPSQLPDAHVMVVDCQGFLSGSGDDMFAAGLSGAMVQWERLRPGGLRQRPLDIDDLARQPLLKLNRWLEGYASEARRKRILLCLDEFDKLVHFIAQGKLSEDVLGLLRGLSQAKGWMVLYSGQYELDDWIMPYAEYIKNVRRVRISYLEEADSRSLLEEPVPDFGLRWERAATDAAIEMTGCQPFLLQMVGTQVVNLLAPSERRVVETEDIAHVRSMMFDNGRYYFQSLQNTFDEEANRALQEIARTGQTAARDEVVDRLVDYEYIEAAGDGWRFRVPLLEECWEKLTVDS